MAGSGISTLPAQKQLWDRLQPRIATVPISIVGAAHGRDPHHVDWHRGVATMGRSYGTIRTGQ